MGEFQSKLDQKMANMRKWKQTIQPFVLVVGDTEKAFYVVINHELMYKLSSAVRAVDVAFKCFQALHACYPIESNSVWLWLQQYVYKIRTTYDRACPAVNALIADIEGVQSAVPNV